MQVTEYTEDHRSVLTFLIVHLQTLEYRDKVKGPCILYSLDMDQSVSTPFLF